MTSNGWPHKDCRHSFIWPTTVERLEAILERHDGDGCTAHGTATDCLRDIRAQVERDDDAGYSRRSS